MHDLRFILKERQLYVGSGWCPPCGDFPHPHGIRSLHRAVGKSDMPDAAMHLISPPGSCWEDWLSIAKAVPVHNVLHAQVPVSREKRLRVQRRSVLGNEVADGVVATGRMDKATLPVAP